MTLTELAGFENNPYLTDKGTTHSYLSVYDKLFYHSKNSKINILEIGFQHGGSCKLWEDYFPNAQIIGLDITDENIKIPGSERVQLIVKDSNTLTKKYFKVIPDIVIDDASHLLEDQIHVIKTIYPILKKGGMIIIEDVPDIDNQKKEFEKIKIPFLILDLRGERNQADNVLLIFVK